MRKTVLCLLTVVLFAVMLQLPPFCSNTLMAQGAAKDSYSKEDAELLYEEAMDFKQKGNMAQAIDSYARAMRIDRGILAQDDHGLIEALRDDCIEKLKTSPEDLKTLETLAFVYAVCYSDYQNAIENYEKIFNLVTDENVKQRTAALIERLRATADVQQEYHAQVSTQLRDERLKSWSEMEKADRFGEDVAAIQEKSARLAETYKMKDSLQNRLPQLEAELKELQDDYDKANRLFYTVTDKGLYERRRRRLKDQIAEKEQEVATAREELNQIEEESGNLERELAAVQKQEDESPVRSYEEYNQNDTGASSGSYDDSGAADYGQPEEDYEQQPLPEIENPDFPDGEADQNKLDDLINNL